MDAGVKQKDSKREKERDGKTNREKEELENYLMFNRSRCVPSNINDKFVTLACTSVYFRAFLFPSVSCGMDPVFKQTHTNKQGS